MDEDFDVVVDVLTKHRDVLQQMVDKNLMSDYVGLNIMDDIRLEQIAQINKCLDMWKRENAQV